MPRLGALRCALVRLAALAAVLLVLWPGGCTPTPPPTSLPPERRTIRVRLMESQEQVVIAASADPGYFTGSDRTPRRLGLPRNAGVPVALAPGGWKVGSASLGTGELTLSPAGSGTLSINGARHHGQYRLVPVAAGRFDVVNDVDVDDYLKGVLSRELMAQWHTESYRALAIAARTYALYEQDYRRRFTNSPRHYDLNSDQRSQVYGGIAAETARSRDAVEYTAGVVLAYGPPGDEHIFKTYYSACCGGISQSVTDAFNEPYIAPLTDQNVGPTCSKCPKFSWGPVVIRKDEMTRRIKAWGTLHGRPEKNIGLVRSVRIDGRNRWGRPVRFSVLDSRDLRYSLTGEELRSAVNTSPQPANSILYSSQVDVIVESDTIRFVNGRGFGHGVGLCQWCTEARAQSGLCHEDILQAAYPRSKLFRVY